MGIRSQTPREPCPFRGSPDIYAGTILTWTEIFGDMVRGSVRCNWCEVGFAAMWSPKYGEKHDRKQLEKLVAKWNRREPPEKGQGQGD